MAIMPRLPLICPLCDQPSTDITVENYGYHQRFVRLQCHCTFDNVCFDEGGLVRFKYSFPYLITEPKTIYDHGFNAFLNGVQLCENPYPGWWRTEKFNEWQKGWREAYRQAAERSPARLSSHPTPAV